MPSASEKPSIIEQYSQTFTRLQAGKRELIQWGAEAVVLNRFIIDEAEATGQSDATPILEGIDLGKVTHGESEAERVAYCETSLRNLVALQEEVFVLQKSAREKGISGGLLTIIGQAASQSPEDNGASVLRQLTDLVQDNTGPGNSPESQSSQQSLSSTSSEPTTATTQPMGTSALLTSADIVPDEVAANDIDRHDLDRMTGLQLLGHTLIGHWKPLVVDASVCAIAAGIAISLIN